MCGINILIDLKKDDREELIHLMNKATRHRGPDDSGTYIHKHKNSTAFVGANRLAISDTSPASQQPFISADQNYVLAYNGEIYNYFELKNTLIREGYQFKTSSDTEVLIYWLIEHGADGISALEGMFAFAFLNCLSNTWIFARDRSGMKPLYYTQSHQYLIFSSEIRGILASGLLRKELNTDQVQHYLQYKYPKSPQTFYRNICELSPGHRLIIADQKIIKVEPFQSARQPEPIPISNDTVSDIRRQLSDGLIRHLHASVPLGIMLSGGVDSTLLLALAHSQGYSVPSFTVANSASDRGYGTLDYKYARMAAKRFNSEWHPVEISDHILQNFESFIKKQDQPVGDSGAFMTDVVCGAASSNVKVLLSGAGADEYFAGYNRHMAYWRYLEHHNLFYLLMPYLRRVKSLLPTSIQHPWRKKFKLYKKFIEGLHIDPRVTFDRMVSFGIFIDEASKTNGRQTLLESNKMHFFNEALEHDRQKYLVDDVLAISDRMSMQHGIEMRMPYLDLPLIQMLERIPAPYLVKNGVKWIPRTILDQLGGTKFTRRSKEGFGLPLGNWLRNKKHAYLWESFSEKNHLFFDFVDKAFFDNIYLRHFQRKEDYSQELWAMLVLGHWLRLEFE